MCPRHALTHMWTHIVGVGYQEMSRAWECCAGKLSGKSPFALSQLRPLPISSLKLDFLLHDWSEETSVLQLPADTHMQEFLDYLDHCGLIYTFT